MAGRALQITYLADAKSVLAAQQQIDRGHSSLQGMTQKTGGVFQTTFGSVMPIAAAAAGAAVLKFGSDSLKAFGESQQVMAQTEAVLRSTGGAAGVTADDIVGLAQRLRDLSGADDEAIQASSNLLLTFREVRNEAGRGNDIFNQTQRSILDMATAMNQGAIPTMDQLKSTTLQVGKAMNDPIRGLTALRRAGVTFTESQEATIKRLVESGDLMGAQKIILHELTAEFGGAAKASGDTFAGAQAKAAQKVEELQERLGAALVPALTEVVATLADLVADLEPAILLIGEGLAGAVELASDNLQTMAGPLKTVLELLPDTSASADEGSASFIDYAKAIANIGNPITTFTNFTGKMNDIHAIFTGTLGEGTEAVEKQSGIIDQLADAMRDAAADARDKLIPAIDDATTSHREAKEAAREQRLAILALSDSFLGIYDSAQQVNEAQRELNQLERQGKEDTKRYEEAVIAALEAQLGLEGAVVEYGKELADSGEKASTVREKIRDLGEQFNIQKGTISDVISQVNTYINRLNGIPGNVHTQVTLGVTTPSELRGIIGAQHGYHGVVTRPTVFVAGEAGSERVDISPRGQGDGASVVVNIGTVVGPGGIEEVAEQIRSALVRTGRRNGTAGIP